jgi:hypothetical protein
MSDLSSGDQTVANSPSGTAEGQLEHTAGPIIDENSPSTLEKSEARFVLPPNQNLTLIIGGLVFASGLLLLVSKVNEVTPAGSNSDPLQLTSLHALLLGIGGAIFLGLGIRQLKPIQIPEETNQNYAVAQGAKFQRYLIGLGYFLALLAATDVLLLSGIGSGVDFRLDQAQPPSIERPPTVPTPIEATDPTTGPVPLAPGLFYSRKVLFLVSMSMSITGVLFFIASKIHKYSSGFKKPGPGVIVPESPPASPGAQPGSDLRPASPELKDDYPEEFSEGKFWGGLCFRVGESMLFTLFVILLFPKTGMNFSLPVICLIMGMFIESAEKFVITLSNRVLAAVTALYAGPTT